MEPNDKIKVVSITLMRAEGNHPDDDFEPMKVKTFCQANAVLRRWSRSVPGDDATHRVDVVIEYEDGFRHEGIYQMPNWTRCPEYQILQETLHDYYMFWAGRKNIIFASQEQYQGILDDNPMKQAHAIRMLEQYDLV